MIRRVTGTGAAATVVLALLVLGCVFVAVAGPRESLATQTQALHKTFAGASPLASSVVASTNWNQFVPDIDSSFSADPQDASVTSQQLGEVTSQLRGDLASRRRAARPRVGGLGRPDHGHRPAGLGSRPGPGLPGQAARHAGGSVP